MARFGTAFYERLVPAIGVRDRSAINVQARLCERHAGSSVRRD